MRTYKLVTMRVFDVMSRVVADVIAFGNLRVFVDVD